MIGFRRKNFSATFRWSIPHLACYRLQILNRKKSTIRSNIVKKLRMLAITLALLGYGATAVATDSRSQSIKSHAPKGITAAFYACVDKADSDTVAAGACLSDEQTRQDNRLNASYKALLGKLNPKAKDALIRAEREWLKFQEANGEFENSIYGNESVANLQLTQNEMFRICERANALDTYLIVANIQ
jgi:uncharacterized protein YecT (DUF1311 family)